MLNNHGDCEEELWLPFFSPSLGVLKGPKPGWDGRRDRKLVSGHSFANNLQYCTVCFKNMLHSKRGKGFHSLLSAAFDL